MNILHITPHLGGGAGKAISGAALDCTEFSSRIFMLEKPEHGRFVDLCAEGGCEIVVEPDSDTIRRAAAESEAVIIDWWAHPLSVKALKALDDTEARLILWSHINGLCYPFLLQEFVNAFDGVMVTSPCVFRNKFWSGGQREQIKKKSRVVYGTGSFQPENCRFKTSYHSEGLLKIGYAGTVDYSKMNRDFPRICSLILESTDNVRFYIYGKCTKEFTDRFFSEYPQLRGFVSFMGFADNMGSVYPELDLFLYPLTPENFATTENSMLEAMAAALPVVALNNPPEAEIIHNGIDGILADSCEDAAKAVIRLCGQEQLRERLGKAARKSIIGSYSIEKNMENMCACINETLKNPKRRHSFGRLIGKTPWDDFLYFCGSDKEKILRIMSGDKNIVLPDIYKSESKSSPRHYLRYYPDNCEFLQLVEMIL